jgi:3,4-dihydroxy 2-butanone 4-phosphate synthase/GTP cyclohydrolase II
VVETLPIIATPNPYNRDYLETKRKKLGHLLEIPDASNNQAEIRRKQ